MLGPVSLAVGNLIKLLLDVCREVIVHNLGEELEQEIVHYNAYVRGHQLRFLCADSLLALLLGQLAVLQCYDVIFALRAALVALLHIAALLYGADCRSVCRRTANSKLLELAYEARLGVAWRMLCETLCSHNFLGCQSIALVYGRYCGCIDSVLIIAALTVYLKKTVEYGNLAGCYE